MKWIFKARSSSKLDWISKQEGGSNLDWISNQSDKFQVEICNSIVDVGYIRTLTTKEAGGEEVVVIFYPKSFPRNFLTLPP